jgi:predicted RNA-binding Zn-ribbon protein involved in translation (DUF1610 family)
LIKDQKSALVRSDSRMGKSSFLAELARRHSKDYIFVHIDLLGITNETRLLELMTRELMATYQGRGGAFEPSAWKLLRSPRLKLAILEQEQLAKPTPDEFGLLPPPPRQKGVSAGEPQKKEVEIQMCPTCEKPLKWVEKYARFYCYNCKKYLPKQRKVRKSILIQDSFLERVCPICGDDTYYVERYSEYYCEECRKYPFVSLRRKISEKFTQSDVVEVFELPQTIASDMKTPVVVMFDEAHELAEFENPAYLRTMRSRFDLQTDTSILFAGNNGPELSAIFDETGAPFYKFGPSIELGPIANEEMEKFLMDRYRSADGKLDNDKARRIVALGGRCPYYIQQIAHELFHISKEPSETDLQSAIETCVALQSHAYKQVWESVKSPLQRRFLLAAVSEPRAAHGKMFVNRYGLKSRSHVQRTEKQLEARGLISDGEVVDPMFVLWLRAVANIA